MDLVRAARDAEPVAGDTSDRAMVTLVDDTDGTRLVDGTQLHHDTALRLACDAAVVALHLQDAKPLDIGRRRRSIPLGINRALRRRDHHCIFPVARRRGSCTATMSGTGTHLGATKIDNLVLLCPFHRPVALGR